MTRHVVSPDMVAHLWANQSQDSARNGRRNNFFFRGPTIYSYRTNWPIARHFRGRVLFNPNKYSLTTSKHERMARDAARHHVKIPCPSLHIAGGTNEDRDWKPDWKSDWAWFEGRLLDIERQILKARTNLETRLNERQMLIEQASNYAEMMGLKRRLVEGDLDLEAVKERCRKQDEKTARARAKADKARAERDRIASLEREEQKKLWIDGHPNAHYRNRYEEPTLMRVRGDKLETSQGASVPLDHAKRAFRAILRCREEGTTWETNGHTLHVGSFAISKIEANGDFRAGCHTIKWEETERIARQLGLYPPPAAEVAA